MPAPQIQYTAHHSRIDPDIKQMTRSSHPRGVSLAYRAGAMVCVLLVIFIGTVAAVHAHPDTAKNPEHSCSICALAHSGVVAVAISAPAPTIASSAVHVTPAAGLRSLLLISSLYIRPPPAV